METLKILGINGSCKKGATLKALNILLSAADSTGNVETSLIDLSGKKINSCIHCNKCINEGLETCPVFKDDFADDFFRLYKQCDALVFASPVYNMNCTGLLQDFISRLRPIGKYSRTGVFGMRIGTSIAVGGRRNGGQDFTITALNNMLLSLGANVIGGGVHFYNGPAVWSKNQKDFTDEIGLHELTVCGRKLAYVGKVIKTGLTCLATEISISNRIGYTCEEDVLNGLKFLGL